MAPCASPTPWGAAPARAPRRRARRSSSPRVRGGSALARALLLDLGNVLVAFDHDRTLSAIARASGAEPERLRAALFGELEASFDRGLLSPTDFFRAAERAAGIAPLPDEVWIPAWRDIFTPIPAALALLPRLAVPTALLSNTNVLHWEGILAVAPRVERLDALALSFRTGAVKPEPAAYRAALDLLGAAPEEAVFADDRAELVEGARALGIDAFQVISPARLARELAARGLLRE